MVFAREGARFVVARRSAAAGQKVCREIESEHGEALFVETDISDADRLADLISHTIDCFGKIDILVNNAFLTGADGAEFINGQIDKVDGGISVRYRASPRARRVK